MSNCLLCAQPLKTKTRFTESIFFSKPPSAVCSDCFASFVEIAEHHCLYCYKSNCSNICRDCQYWQAQGRTVSHTALYEYNEAMASYFSQYKFQGDYILRKVFAKKLKMALSQYPDYTIVPIPLSSDRLAERGFNQVEGLLEAANIPYQSFLGKDDSERQSSKSRIERLKTDQVFYLLKESEVPDKILLFDDIYTTGATLQLAISLFLKIGRKEIKTFSLTR
ncbi:ComF family protein [Streptococcus ruminantium]|nr:ComF family protein [Streptococcus ruminantium]MDQ8767925.1 ComF family protein [Streptococcus ruminantium]MDQ8781032.1 ComF family protein [Streptococcus ruminantium]